MTAAVLFWVPCGVVAAAAASEHARRGIKKQGLKGICSPSAPMIISDWLLQMATTAPLFFCFQMSPILQQEAAPVSRVSKETKTWECCAPNYTVLSSKRSSAIACKRTSSAVVVERMFCVFPSSSVGFMAEGKKGSPSEGSFVVCCATFSKCARLPDLTPAVPFHSPPPPLTPQLSKHTHVIYWNDIRGC